MCKKFSKKIGIFWHTAWQTDVNLTDFSEPMTNPCHAWQTRLFYHQKHIPDLNNYFYSA